MIYHRRNLLESYRPELVLNGFKIVTDSSPKNPKKIIKIESIKNVGRGAAYHIVAGGNEGHNAHSVNLYPLTNLPILAPNETASINGEILVFLKHINPNHDEKLIPVHIKIYYSDSHGRRYITQYKLTFSDHTGREAFEIAPGVTASRKTTVLSTACVVLSTRFARVPGVSRLLNRLISS